MARSSGGAKVDTYVHEKFNVRIDIRLNRDTGEFSAMYQDQWFRAPSLIELKEKLDAEMKNLVALTWIPVIYVKFHGQTRTLQTRIANCMEHQIADMTERDDDIDSSLKLDAKRFHIAKRPDGKWLRTRVWRGHDEMFRQSSEEYSEWDHDERHRTSKGNAGMPVDFSVLPAHWVGHRWQGCEPDSEHLLPYTDATWSALQAIANNLGLLKERLNDLVSTTEGLKRLQTFASRMLPAAPGEKKA